MNKRYQVFISSTFKDLEKERKLLTQTLLRKGCFPAGMEWFPAVDEEQFEYIKQVIDDTDYYVIILGGLYGTIAPDGKSYTEKEYDYAVEKGKKVIALVQKDPELKEEDDNRLIKFTQFRQKVTNNRLVNFWTTPEELSSKFSTSLDYAMKNYPEQGWIRCNKDICDVRLQFEDMNLRISSLKIQRVKSIHIMASRTAYYLPIVKNLLKKNKNKKLTVNIYVYFRLGNDAKRINSLKNEYNSWWENIKNEYPKIKFTFICVKDFKMSFRGVVVNRNVGVVGFYYRENDNTYGTAEDSIFVDENTDVGRYILHCFLKCFDEQKEYLTMRDCVENSVMLEVT